MDDSQPGQQMEFPKTEVELLGSPLGMIRRKGHMNGSSVRDVDRPVGSACHTA